MVDEELVELLLSSPLLAQLEPGMAEWIRADIAARIPRWDRLSSAEVTVRRAAERELSDVLAARFATPVPDSVEISEVVLPDSGLRVRRHRPAGAVGPLPTQLFLHGGGFTSGHPAELVNDSALANRAAATGIQQLALYYPLAPEHPYPAARDAVVAAAAEVLAAPGELGVDPARFGAAGNSAGATIVASAALLAGARGEQPFTHLYLEVPAGGLRPDAIPPAADPIAGPSGPLAAALIQAYLPDGVDDGFGSPADAVTVVGMPPTLIFTGEFDPLRPTAEKLAARLAAAAVEVSLRVMPGHLHASCQATATSALAREWQRTVNQLLKDAFAVSNDGRSSHDREGAMY